MIQFESAAEWQAWLDETFPKGAKAAATRGNSWEVTPRIVVEGYADGYVEVGFMPWGYARMLYSRFKSLDPMESQVYAYVQYRTVDVMEGYPGMTFSGDVASADQEVLAKRRANAMTEENRY